MTTKNILKSLRALHDLTQKDMATKLNISKATYNRKELGQSQFTLSESKIIADTFKKQIDEIFFTHACNTKGTFDTSA